MKLKKIILIVIALLIVIGLTVLIVWSGKKNSQDNGKLQVVVSNFASYDFLRAIIGENDNVELTFLIGPGKDAHSYVPGPQDMVKIQKADLFVYVGGDSERWVEDTLKTVDKNNTKVICIADYVDKLEEQEIDGAEEEEEEEEEEGAFDDHIWTSPSNAIKMIEVLEESMEEIDGENAIKYKENSESYIAKIKEVDKKIQEVVDNRVRDTLVFGDKMPMQYFIDYYDLKVSAAFSGCSTETEPSARTVAYLEKKVIDEKIPVVLYIELNNGRVAKTIAEEASNYCEALQIQTLHNVTLDDFNNDETWVSLMTRNIEVLKKALQ